MGMRETDILQTGDSHIKMGNDICLRADEIVQPVTKLI